MRRFNLTIMVTTKKMHLLHQLLLIGKFDYFILTLDEFYAVKTNDSNINKTKDGVNAKTDSEQREKEI